MLQEKDKISLKTFCLKKGRFLSNIQVTEERRMSENFKEFCSRKGLKSFASGKTAKKGESSCLGTLLKAYLIYKAASAVFGYYYSPDAVTRGETKESLLEASRRSGYVTAANDTLLSYNYNGTERHEERLQSLVGLVMQTPTGKKVLQDMADKNCVLMMEPIGLSTAGFFQPSCNALCLNSWMSDDLLAATLVHEGTHALQHHRSGYSLSEKYEKASLFMIGRTMEADAVRAETQFAFEAAELGFTGPLETLKKHHPKITAAYEAGVEKFGADAPETARETMKAWFKETDYARLYEKQYAKAVKRCVEKADSAMLSAMFSVPVPTDSIVSKLCRTENGKRYFDTNGAAIETADIYYLHSSVKKDMDEADEKFRKRTKEVLGTEKSDLSHKTFYVLERDGKISVPERPLPRTIHFYDAASKAQKNR